MNDTYSALITQLTNATMPHIDNTTDISYDNSDFNPSGSNAWIQSIYLPSGRDGESKDGVGDADSGIFQVNVYVPLNDSTGGIKQYNLRALEIAEGVMNAFSRTTRITFNATTVYIDSATSTTLPTTGSWYQMAISINYTRLL